MEINAMFRDTSLSSGDFSAMLARASAIVDTLATKSPLMTRANWYLKGNTFGEATLYPAFTADGAASTATIAVLTEEFRRGASNVSHAAIWNTRTGPNEGASMSCRVSDAKVLADNFALRVGVPACFATAYDLADVTKTIVATFQPLVVETSSAGYFEKQVFDDKPGVGWMLYLPKIITVQQVPEARALIPVPERGKNQTGTLIVSVTDAVFSIDNPEHIEIANRIEIRLVDQGLLPRYTDL